SLVPCCFITVSIYPKCQEAIDTKSFQLVSHLTGQLDSQRIFVPCEARILWYSADRTSSRALRDTTELWDLMRILNAGADFILGCEALSNWVDWHKALPVVKGVEMLVDERDAWEWLRNPLPPGDEEPTLASLRLQLGIPDKVFFTDKGFGSLGFFEQQTFLQTLAPGYYREHTSIARHTVLRRRQTLEEAGLLEKVAVTIHPDPHQPTDVYRGVGFAGLGLLTNHPFDL